MSRAKSNIGRRITVIVGEYKGLTGSVVLDRENVLYVRPDPSRRNWPVTAIVSANDLRFVGETPSHLPLRKGESYEGLSVGAKGGESCG